MARARSVQRNLAPTAADIARLNQSLHTRGSDEAARLDRLRSYSPQDGRTLPPDVHEQVVALVASTPFKSHSRDNDLIAAVTHNALYDLNVHGAYEPRRAMSEAGIAQWSANDLKPRGVLSDSRGDYASRIRAVAKHNGLAPHLTARKQHTRTPATPPADPKAWRRTLDRADRLPEALRSEVRLLADLTFGAGLRPSESARARRDDITRTTDGTIVISVANDAGALRNVPLSPLVAARVLDVARDPADLLIRPHRARKNVINGLLADAEEKVSGVRFDIWAARHRFVVDLLAEPLPLRVICEVADLGAGTVADLMPYVAAPTQQKMIEMIRGCWS